MPSADLGQPILFFILAFWAFIAIAGILTTLAKKGKISGKILKDKFHKSFHSSSDRTHSHS